MKKLFLVLGVLTSQIAFAQEVADTAHAEIKWLNIEEAYAQNQLAPKKILIDVYTDWCGWCKRMDKTTYENQEIIRYINANFYPVKLDGEDKNDITILGNTFKFVQNGRNGYHELAAALLDGKLSYPTTVFMDETFQLLQPVPGYLDAAGIEPILWYFSSDAYKTTDWDTFQKSFSSKL